MHQASPGQGATPALTQHSGPWEHSWPALCVSQLLAGPASLSRSNISTGRPLLSGGGGGAVVPFSRKPPGRVTRRARKKGSSRNTSSAPPAPSQSGRPAPPESTATPAGAILSWHLLAGRRPQDQPPAPHVTDPGELLPNGPTQLYASKWLHRPRESCPSLPLGRSIPSPRPINPYQR